MLSERDRPDGERRPIPRAAWSFVAPGDGAAATEITLDGGFKPGRIYELTYTARDPMVVAAGMAGIRDLMSYLRNNPPRGSTGAAGEHHLLRSRCRAARSTIVLMLAFPFRAHGQVV